MGRISAVYTAILLGFSTSLPAAPETADDELPIIRLSPAVRESDRGADFYQRVPCRELGTADVRTDAERAHLDARKQQCLEKYRQFAPRSFQR
ncbi:MAG: hypothetical protein CMN84_07835 [Spongiibacteraceae bacterium]|jgi:hypothetical protein|nr:hypothetical protein [Spongiibacteraceae bacterium]